MAHRVGSWGRNAIREWRVKSGRRDVYSDTRRANCLDWIRQHQREYTTKLRLVPPNF